MSTINQLERQDVCICPKVRMPAFERGIYGAIGVRATKPTQHRGDCPFFEDYSTSETAEAEEREPSIF